MNTSQIATAVTARRRRLSTGSAAAEAHERTNAQLNALLAETPHDTLMGGHRTYTLRELQRAATLELAWRRETGVAFGWTRA